RSAQGAAPARPVLLRRVPSSGLRRSAREDGEPSPSEGRARHRLGLTLLLPTALSRFATTGHAYGIVVVEVVVVVVVVLPLQQVRRPWPLRSSRAIASGLRGAAGLRPPAARASAASH